MKLTITTLNNNVYKFADKTIADDEQGVFRGRIKNQINLNRSFSELGSNISTISIQIINNDKIIPDSEKLWNAKAELITDTSYKWVGKITSYQYSNEGILNLVATERTAPELTKYLPDEFIRLVTVDENVHSSALNVTIPLVVGGTTENPIAVKGILKNKTNGIYYLCVGEIQAIINVRVGKEILTRSEAEAKGYMCYTGSASQTNEKGIAYIQITNESLRKNDDGSYVEIGAEVVGLKLGSHTENECRNGARFLYWLLKTPATGYCGWGLGIDENDIDLNSFNTAIATVDFFNLKLDGIIYEQKTAQNWITEICRAIRGNYEISSDGKRRLYVQSPEQSVYTYTENNIELVYNGVRAFTGRVYNCGILEYAYNPITAQFMQSAFYENTDSIEELDRQEFNGESYLIRDAATAQAILDYTCKNSLVAAETIAFSTRFLPQNCKVGSIITLNHSLRNVSGLYRITALQIGDHINRIEACKYDPDVFNVGSISAQVSWTDEADIVSSNQPASASGLNLTSEIRTLQDGSSTVVLVGTFTLPNGEYLGASVEYGEGLSPASWLNLGIMQGNKFEITSVKYATLYSVRVKMLSSTSHSEYITGTITTAGNNTVPAAPVISASPYLKNIKLSFYANEEQIKITGFKIFRSETENGDYTNIGYITALNDSASFIDQATDYFKTYYYKAKTISKWGIESPFGNVSSCGISKIITNDIEAQSITTELITTEEIIGKNFVTAQNVGADQDGIRFSENGIEAWNDGEKSVNIEIDGKAEFNDITARGKIKTAVFEYDKVSALGGELLVRPGDIIKDSDSGPNPNTVLGEYFDDLKSILGNDSDYADSDMEQFSGDFASYDEEIFGDTRDVLYSEKEKAIPTEEYTDERAEALEFSNSNRIFNILYKPPTLSLSAYNCTAESIAQPNGVIDISGNDNNGRAYGGVQIAHDNDMGNCFSFDGTDDYMEFNKASFLNSFTGIKGLTISFKMRPENITGSELVIFEGFYDANTTLFAVRIHQGKINYYVRRKTSDSWQIFSSTLSLVRSSLYEIFVVFDFINEKASLFSSGLLDSEYNTGQGSGTLSAIPTFCWVGKHAKPNRFYKGLLYDLKIRPYALSAAQINDIHELSNGSVDYSDAESYEAEESEQYTNLYDIIGAGNYTDTRGHLRELYQFNKLNDSTLNENNEFDSDLDNFYQTLLDTEQARGEDLNEILTESFDVETSMYKTPYSEYEASEGGGNKYYVTSNAYFNVGDIIRIKNGVSEDMWLTVSETGNDEKGEYVKGSLIHGDEFTPTSGQTIVNYGSSGSGGILLDGNKPTVDLFNHSGEPWNPTLLMRLGNLNGSYNETTDKYGIGIGNANGQYLKYTPDGGLYIKGNIYADGGDISGASGTFGTGANAITIDSNGISSTNFSVNASTGAVTANNITATGGTYSNITANNITATGGTYNNITANNLTANNVTANGGTYNSITANNINISGSNAEAMQIGDTCYNPDDNSISMGVYPRATETASIWLYLGEVTNSRGTWIDDFYCKSFKLRVFQSLISLNVIGNGTSVTSAVYTPLAGQTIESVFGDCAKIYYVDVSERKRKLYLKFPSITAWGVAVRVFESPNNDIELTKTTPTGATYLMDVVNGTGNIIIDQLFHTAANGAGAEDGYIKLFNNFVIQYGKAVVNASSGETSCNIRVIFPIKMASATPCVFCAPVTRDGSPLGWLNISSDTYNNGITVSQTGVTIQANCYNGNTRIYWFYWLCLGIAATS